jgi:hypothetical protein
MMDKVWMVFYLAYARIEHMLDAWHCRLSVL